VDRRARQRVPPRLGVPVKQALALVILLTAPAFAKGGKKPAPAADEEAASDDGSDDDTDDSEKKPQKKPPPAEEEAPPAEAKDFQKQDLSGHDLGSTKKANEFERDRFFVDKVDGPKTAKTTLVQGSISSSTFYYGERGGAYAAPTGTTTPGDDSASFSRMFTEVRLQTDFRHISGGKWDARVDARIRAVTDPTDTTYMLANTPVTTTPTHIQSGLNGQNEYDIRELWLLRNGERSDIFIGRQFVPDLAAVKIDGVRVDYASSSKVTLLGFAGLFPVRGSRSITTDYTPLRNDSLDPAGKLVGTEGFGAAYRTIDAYGSIGGVIEHPFQGESPRVFATSAGYYRSGASLDLYHFAVIDLLNQAYGSGSHLTNLSVGANYKPSPRLRLTASFNRVDTETLNVQANAFLNPGAVPTPTTAVDDETFIRRLSTNSARAGVSAGLGQLQRFELSAAATFRYRPALTLLASDGTTKYPLAAGEGVDLYASLIDRHSIKDMRLGLDVSASFAVGNVAFQRSEVQAVRGFASRELASGKGEWELEVSYAATKDKSAGINCADVASCYGASTGSLLSLGGNLYYRINRDWFMLASMFLSHQSIVHTDGTMLTTDPSITGLTGFFRIGYRF